MEDVEEEFKEYYNYQNENFPYFLTEKENEHEIPNCSINDEKSLYKIEKEKYLEIQITGITFEQDNEKIISNPEEKKQILNNNMLIYNNILEEKIPNIKDNGKKLGRKRKNSKEIGKHNKYSEDNILRKIKSMLLSYVFNFINLTINKLYEGNTKKGIFQKELKKINQSQILDTKKNKEFLYKTLKDIFSVNISTKYSFYTNDYNINLIRELLNENDYEKRTHFKNLFSLTFLDCLMHFRGNKYYEELKGLEFLNKYREKFEEDKDYLQLFDYYILHFEEITIKKRHRNRKKN